LLGDHNLMAKLNFYKSSVQGLMKDMDADLVKPYLAKE